MSDIFVIFIKVQKQDWLFTSQLLFLPGTTTNNITPFHIPFHTSLLQDDGDRKITQVTERPQVMVETTLMLAFGRQRGVAKRERAELQREGNGSHRR